MAIYTDGWRLPPPRSATDYPASFGEAFGATVSSAVDEGPVSLLAGIAELEQARGIDYSQMGGADPFAERAPPAAPSMVPMDEAKARVKAAGLEGELKLGDGADIAAPALDIMLDRARTRRERAITLARGPAGILPNAALFGTSFLVGAIDPLNLAVSFIPVVGEARYARLMAGAGESLSERASVRAMSGAASGVVGQAAIEPIDWFAHTQDGRDYGAVDVLHNLLFGAALGGALHSGGGAIADAVRAKAGKPLYPFAAGEPFDPARHAGPDLDLAPAVRTINDMPPQAKQDAMRGALASLIDGEPVRTGEMLRASAEIDPRIADAFEAPVRQAPASEPNIPLVVARKMQDGSIRLGEPGQIHADLVDPSAHHLSVSGDQMGFAKPGDGQFLSRDEATTFLDQQHPEISKLVDGRRDGARRQIEAGQLNAALAAHDGPRIPGPRPVEGTRLIPPAEAAGGAAGESPSAKPQHPAGPGGSLQPPPQPPLGPDRRASAAAWQALVQHQFDFNAPEALAASRAAEALPEPHPAEMAPADATQAWTSHATQEATRLAEQTDRAFDDAVNLGFITERELETVMDRLEAFEREDAARRELLERAAACLASGLGAVA